MLPPRACPLLLLLLHGAALKPASLNLGVTARSLVDSYRTYRSDGRVEPLEEFVASAVAAFRHEFSLDVVLMELDLAAEAGGALFAVGGELADPREQLEPLALVQPPRVVRLALERARRGGEPRGRAAELHDEGARDEAAVVK